MNETEQEVVVVGGGPCGMIAAIEAAKTLRVVLLERNEKLGKKLYITGKGRCNVCNASDLQGLVANSVHNGRFFTARSPLSAAGN